MMDGKLLGNRRASDPSLAVPHLSPPSNSSLLHAEPRAVTVPSPRSQSSNRMHIRDLFKHSDSPKSSSNSNSDSLSDHSVPISSPPPKNQVVVRSQRPWKASPKRKWIVPEEQEDGWRRTQTRVSQAVEPFLGIVSTAAYEVLAAAADTSSLAPIPGLEGAARLLLRIWNAIQQVDSNRLACLRLAERCADILVAIREEIMMAGPRVQDQLRVPMIKLKETFFEIYQFLQHHIGQSFLKRFIQKDDMLIEIEKCNTSLADCLNHFDRSILIRLLGNVSRLTSSSPLLSSHIELESGGVVEELEDLGLGVRTFSESTTDHGPTEEEIRATLHQVQREQNVRDRVRDTSDLRSLLQMAVNADNDADMIKVLQVGKEEMPEAIKALLRALERHIQDEVGVVRNSWSPRLSSPLLRSMTWPPDQSRRFKVDLLEHEFIERASGALKRGTKGPPPNLPSWTITKFEIRLGHLIGRGYFSHVYKGTWRKQAVAVKVLEANTRRESFANEVSIWKSLKHPNVLELFGASSTSGSLPWFLVSPYMKNGSLVDFLKRQEWEKGAHGVTSSLMGVDSLKMMHEIATGMNYLHEHRVVHGDLRASNILVDSEHNCLVADFGQSRFHSHVNHTNPLPQHAMRWQSPELLSGRSLVTKEVDVYAYGITCTEILNFGAVPFPNLGDDAVKREVLDNGARPTYPTEIADILGVRRMICEAWADSPGDRPSFSQIIETLSTLRGIYPSGNTEHSPLIIVSEFEEENDTPYHTPRTTLSTHSSPSGQENLVLDFSSDVERRFPSVIAAVPEDAMLFRQDPLSPFDTDMQRQLLINSPNSAAGSFGEISSIQDAKASDAQDELIYRLCLSHDFPNSLTLPLWSPGFIGLGDIGYLAKPSGKFIKLFNAMDPARSSEGCLPSSMLELSRFGPVSTEYQMFNQPSFARRAKNTVTNLLTFSDRTRSPPTFEPKLPLQLTRQKSAFLLTETAKYEYLKDIHTCKRWLQTYWKLILQTYAFEHSIQKEDLIMVVESLTAADFALLVSHGTEQEVHFDVLGPREAGHPWGEFHSGLTHEEIIESDLGYSCTTKVSSVGDPPSTLLVGRLRFQPDISEPVLQ